MSKYEKEVDYIIEEIETNRGSEVSRVVADGVKSKTIKEIIAGAPNNLDKQIVGEMLDRLIVKGRIMVIDYNGAFMVVGSTMPVKEILINYSEQFID